MRRAVKIKLQPANPVKAKFHYAIQVAADLVCDLDSVMECGLYPANCC